MFALRKFADFSKPNFIIGCVVFVSFQCTIISLYFRWYHFLARQHTSFWEIHCKFNYSVLRSYVSSNLVSILIGLKVSWDNCSWHNITIHPTHTINRRSAECLSFGFCVNFIGKHESQSLAAQARNPSSVTQCMLTCDSHANNNNKGIYLSMFNV